ncbi:hypothetical protein [Kitasatospora griseola]|uniref:hypothetical protein n=1 Tax=Kitasatospora griseola TaxID=2064 RepID=UPI0038142FA3
MAQVVAHLRAAFDALTTAPSDTGEAEDEDGNVDTALCELAQICAPVPAQQAGLTDEALIARVLADPKLAARTAATPRQHRRSAAEATTEEMVVSKTAVRTAARLGHGWSSSNSRFSVAKNDSVSALSQHPRYARSATEYWTSLPGGRIHDSRIDGPGSEWNTTGGARPASRPGGFFARNPSMSWWRRGPR